MEKKLPYIFIIFKKLILILLAYQIDKKKTKKNNLTTHTLACIMHRKSKEIECVLDKF
jgi:hypothetical protein